MSKKQEFLELQVYAYREMAEHDHKTIDHLTKELKELERENKSIVVIALVFLIVALVGWVV